MKMKFRKRVVAMTLAAMMMAAPVSGTVFATDENAPDQPDKPVAVSYEDNDKIEEYNKKVEEYNKAAEEYNAAVDKEYEQAVEETAQKNAEIEQHNEAEVQRVKEAEERNEKAVKEAEEENAKIDEENAAEEARVTEHNASEDEKVKASEEAIAAAEKENEEVAAHNEAAAEAAVKYEADKAQYEADQAQYEADQVQYQKDQEMEARIKKAGYESVEKYNETINKHYNEPARSSVEKNASAKAVNVGETYSITEAEDKSGVMIRVHIEHNFDGTDASFEENFEIDRNDIIKLNSVAAVGNPTQPGYASFYYPTDDNHTMGYWVLGYEVLMDNAKYKNSEWNCGTSYEISYKDGANHVNDIEDIDISYNYTWMPLKVYKTYNVPKAPTAPTAPTAPEGPKAYVDVPDRYTPNYLEYVKKDHVTANLEEIEKANILDAIAAPVKKAYLSLLDYIALFEKPQEALPAAAPEKAAPETEEVPEVTPAVQETPEKPQAAPSAPAAPAAPAAPTVQAEPAPAAPAQNTGNTVNTAPAAQTVPEVTATVQESPDKAQSSLIDDQDTPMAEMTETSPVMISDSQTPLADGSYWALLNLIMTIVTGIISAILLAGYFGRKDSEEDEDEYEESETKRKGLARLASLIPAVSAVIIFILTEDMSNPMILTDKWTLLMAVILLIQAVVAIISRKKKEDGDEAEAEETMNA